jgi:hypothetical protein
LFLSWYGEWRGATLTWLVPASRSGEIENLVTYPLNLSLEKKKNDRLTRTKERVPWKERK